MNKNLNCRVLVKSVPKSCTLELLQLIFENPRCVGKCEIDCEVEEMEELKNDEKNGTRDVILFYTDEICAKTVLQKQIVEHKVYRFHLLPVVDTSALGATTTSAAANTIANNQHPSRNLPENFVKIETVETGQQMPKKDKFVVKIEPTTSSSQQQQHQQSTRPQTRSQAQSSTSSASATNSSNSNDNKTIRNSNTNSNNANKNAVRVKSEPIQFTTFNETITLGDDDDSSPESLSIDDDDDIICIDDEIAYEKPQHQIQQSQQQQQQHQDRRTMSKQPQQPQTQPHRVLIKAYEYPFYLLNNTPQFNELALLLATTFAAKITYENPPQQKMLIIESPHVVDDATAMHKAISDFVTSRFDRHEMRNVDELIVWKLLRDKAIELSKLTRDDDDGEGDGGSSGLSVVFKEATLMLRVEGEIEAVTSVRERLEHFYAQYKKQQLQRRAVYAQDIENVPPMTSTSTSTNKMTPDKNCYVG